MYLVKIRNLNYDKGGKLISLELVLYPVHVGITQSIFRCPLSSSSPDYANRNTSGLSYLGT